LQFTFTADLDAALYFAERFVAHIRTCGFLSREIVIRFETPLVVNLSEKP
jgi:hypothetical protein